MPGVQLQISKNQIVKAGKALRKHYRGVNRLTATEMAEAIDKLDHWRECHSYPLQKATMGLRQRAKTERCQDPRVSQRLKRRPTIVDKLLRQPTMQLTTMQDIAGCRAVLSSPDEVRRVHRRWHRTGTVVDERDYIALPKDSGYRGVHVIVEYDGFPTEVQLRTQLQHAWGVSIERVGPRIGKDLKSGEGPPEILDLYRQFAGLLASAEGLPADDFEFDELVRLMNEIPQEVLAMVGLELSGDSIHIAIGG